MKRSLLALLATVAVTTSACGGGGGGTAVAPHAAPTTAAQGVGQATFSVRVPVKTATSSSVRAPKYVSPDTHSVSFTASGTTTVVPLTLGGSTCPLSGGYYTCSAQANVGAGTNVAITVSTYQSSDGSGTPLSTNTISQTVIAGQANPISVTLNGVVSSLVLNVASSFAIGTASSTTATVVAKDAAGDTIIGPGSLVDANNNALTISLADSDTSGATTVSGNATNGYTIAYNGAAIASPTLSLSATGLTTVTKQVRVDSAVIDGDFTIAGTTNNSVGPPWYTCGVAHTALAAGGVNAQPTPVPSPVAQGTGAATPTPFPTVAPSPSATPVVPPVQLAATLPSGVANSITGAYTQYAMVNQAPIAGVSPSPKSYKSAIGICQNITIPSGTPSLNLQVLEGGDDNFANTDTEATLFAPSSATVDGTLIATAPVATLFAEDNCWDAAAWEPIFLGSNYGGTGTGSTISATGRFAACPETPGGTPPYPSGVTGLGGYWYTKSIPIPAGEVGGSYTLFLGIWRAAGSGTPALATNAYYSFAFFTGVNLH
jgi:hypothetical protein